MVDFSNTAAITNLIPQVPPLSLVDPKERLAPVEVVKRASKDFAAENNKQEELSSAKKAEDKKKAAEEALKEALSTPPPIKPESLATVVRNENQAAPQQIDQQNANSALIVSVRQNPNNNIEPSQAPVTIIENEGQQKSLDKEPAERQESVSPRAKVESDGAATLARAQRSVTEVTNNFAKISNLAIGDENQPKTSLIA